MKCKYISLLTAAVMVLGTPVLAHSKYIYPDSAAFQPFAVIEPVTPDSLLQTWTGDVELAGKNNLGFGLDYLRNQEETDDWDVILTATGLFRSGDKLLWGISAPYLIRDSDFNESGLLDLRLFARMRLLGQAPAFRVSGELTSILPTGKNDDNFPLTLDSPVLGARLAFASGSEDLRAGGNVGYQTYLDTESGNDSDILYSVWVEKDLDGPYRVAGVYSGSQHVHTGTPGDDKVSDSYIQVGIRRVRPEKTALGLAVGTDVGGDSFADLRIMATAVFQFGKASAPKEKKKAVKEEKTVRETKAKETPPPPEAPVTAYSGPVVVMIAEGVADKDIEKQVNKALQQKGFATGMDPDPNVKVTKNNVLWYNAGMQEQAINVLRTLVTGGYIKDLEIKKSKKPIARNWLILVLGGEK